MIANRFEQIRLTDEQQTNIKDMVYFINQITLSKTNTIKEFRMIGSLAKGLLLNSSRITVDLVAMVDHLPLKEEVPQIQREVNLLLSQIFQEVDVSAEVKRSRKGDLVIENKSDVNYSFNILLHCYNSIWLPAARKNQVTEEHVDVEHFVFVELAMLQVPWCQDNMDQQMKVLALILKDIKKRSRSLNVPHANVLHPWMLEWLSWCVKKELKMIYSRLTNAMYLELFLDQLTYPHSVFKIRKLWVFPFSANTNRCCSLPSHSVSRIVVKQEGLPGPSEVLEAARLGHPDVPKFNKRSNNGIVQWYSIEATKRKTSSTTKPWCTVEAE